MKVHRYLIIGVLVAALTITGIAVSSTEADTDHFTPKTAEEKAWMDYVYKEINKKLFEAYDDGMAVFGIDKEKYQYYDLHADSEEIKELSEDSAQQLFSTVYSKVLGKDKDIKQGDIKPGLFINKEDLKEAFVLFKATEDGKNYIYWFQRDESENTWSLSKKNVKAGKKLKPLKMKKLEEFKASQQAD
ncbi:hypothetical protein LOK74_09960 [Brevibacillus humidisoli]|uniref:hypothetical protein n=1 Tax=Brevibacillus humidisoli TaxID=2895522 RepID=UPI001E2D7083|nr:hypothetical protein [Brevibacillus humidisoli]UFJ42789.1 hypothetical protein LOK74_09960 [Brevibacillus humidisoli]